MIAPRSTLFRVHLIFIESSTVDQRSNMCFFWVLASVLAVLLPARRSCHQFYSNVSHHGHASAVHVLLDDSVRFVLKRPMTCCKQKRHAGIESVTMATKAYGISMNTTVRQQLLEKQSVQSTSISLNISRNICFEPWCLFKSRFTFFRNPNNNCRHLYRVWGAVCIPSRFVKLGWKPWGQNPTPWGYMGRIHLIKAKKDNQRKSTTKPCEKDMAHCIH